MFILINPKLMLRTALRLSPSFMIPIMGRRNENDYDTLNKQDNKNINTGFERVKRMYTINEFGEISVELNNVTQMAMCGAFFGACLGGFVKSKDAYLYFIENNQATIFKTTMQAKKKLQDFVTVAFAKGAYHWGWRLGIFSGIFGVITTTVSVYRNDSSLVDYVMAGAITGAVYKANLGAAAMLVGAGLGAVLSFVGGLAILGILKVTGKNMNEIRESLFKIRTARQEQYNQVLEKSATEKHDNLTRHHDAIVQEKGIAQVEDLS